MFTRCSVRTICPPRDIEKRALPHTHTHRLVYLPTARMCVCVSEHVDFAISAEHDRSIHTYSSVQLQLNQAQNNHSAAHTNILTQRSVVVGVSVKKARERISVVWTMRPGLLLGDAQGSHGCAVCSACVRSFGAGKSTPGTRHQQTHFRTPYTINELHMCLNVYVCVYVCRCPRVYDLSNVCVKIEYML